MTTGPHAVLAAESLPATQLPQLQPVPSQPTAVAAHAARHDATAALATASANLLLPSLTPSQRGELELAKTRAERAAAGRSRVPPIGTSSTAAAAAATAAAANAFWGTGAGGGGGAGGSGKRNRGGGGVGAGDASMPNSDDEDGGDHSDGELELSRLSPEEQERVLTARLAGGGPGVSDKDSRRLKRLLRNRVSAQQARERKKQYVSSLEEQIREQQSHIGVLEKRLEAVQSQNEALRSIIMTMRGFSDNPPAGAAGATRAGGGAAADAAAAGRPPAGRAAVAAAAPRTQPQPPLQGVRGPNGPGARPGGGAQQQPDQVVPDLPPGPQDLDALLELGQQQEQDQQQRQRHVPATRHSRAQLLAGAQDAAAAVAGPAESRPPKAPRQPAAAAGLPFHGVGGLHHPAATAAVPAQLRERSGDGSGSSPSVGFAAAPGLAGLGAAAHAAPPTHGSDELRYPTPVLGQLPPEMLAAVGAAGLPFSSGYGADDDAVPPDIEVPDCGGAGF